MISTSDEIALGIIIEEINTIIEVLEDIEPKMERKDAMQAVTIRKDMRVARAILNEMIMRKPMGKEP